MGLALFDPPYDHVLLDEGEDVLCRSGSIGGHRVFAPRGSYPDLIAQSFRHRSQIRW
jgi:hypothetical protein